MAGTRGRSPLRCRSRTRVNPIPFLSYPFLSSAVRCWWVRARGPAGTVPAVPAVSEAPADPLDALASDASKTRRASCLPDTSGHALRAEAAARSDGRTLRARGRTINCAARAYANQDQLDRRLTDDSTLTRATPTSAPASPRRSTSTSELLRSVVSTLAARPSTAPWTSPSRSAARSTAQTSSSPATRPRPAASCGHRITNSLHLARVRRARQQREARR